MFDRDTCINHLAQFETYCSHTVDSSVQARRRAFYLVAYKKLNLNTLKTSCCFKESYRW